MNELIIEHNIIRSTHTKKHNKYFPTKPLKSILLFVKNAFINFKDV